MSPSRSSSLNAFTSISANNSRGVAAYSATLKKCSEHCALGAFVEEALRDRFVCGLRSRQFQKRLLAEKSLTWKTAVDCLRWQWKLLISKPTVSEIRLQIVAYTM